MLQVAQDRWERRREARRSNRSRRHNPANYQANPEGAGASSRGASPIVIPVSHAGNRHVCCDIVTDLSFTGETSCTS